MNFNIVLRIKRRRLLRDFIKNGITAAFHYSLHVRHNWLNQGSALYVECGNVICENRNA